MSEGATDLGQALVRFLHPTDDVKDYLEQTILPVLTPSLERLLRTANERGAIKKEEAKKEEGEDGEHHHKHHHHHHHQRKDSNSGQGATRHRRGSTGGGEKKSSRRASASHVPAPADPVNEQFSSATALLWLSDHLRQFADPPGQTKYRERFDARRAAMREYLASMAGTCTLDLLDKPPQLDLDLEEPKADSEVEEAVALLRAVPGNLISMLPSGAVDKVVSALSFADFEEGTVLSEQGAPLTHVFFVCEGEVEAEAKAGVNATDTDDLSMALLRRTYSRGHWWPAECVLDTPYLTTTKAFGKVRLAQLPVDFFRALVLPASLQARQIVFSEVYNSPAVANVPRYARALLALDCVERAVAEDEATLHKDPAAVVVMVEGHAGGPSGDTFKAGEIVGKLYQEESWGPLHGSPACRAYVAPRSEILRVFVDPIAGDALSKIQNLP